MDALGDACVVWGNGEGGGAEVIAGAATPCVCVWGSCGIYRRLGALGRKDRGTAWGCGIDVAMPLPHRESALTPLTI